MQKELEDITALLRGIEAGQSVEEEKLALEHCRLMTMATAINALHQRVAGPPNTTTGRPSQFLTLLPVPVETVLTRLATHSATASTDVLLQDEHLAKLLRRICDLKSFSANMNEAAFERLVPLLSKWLSGSPESKQLGHIRQAFVLLHEGVRRFGAPVLKNPSLRREWRRIVAVLENTAEDARLISDMALEQENVMTFARLVKSVSSL